MKRDETQLIPAPQSLGRLRLRLTAWYVVTLFATLLVLGIALFATITNDFDSNLDTSLRVTAQSLVSAARTRGVEAGAGSVVAPGRQLFVFGSGGRSVGSAQTAPWLGELASRAARDGAQAARHESADGSLLRAYAQPFIGSDNRRYVAIATGDEIEVEDKYTALIAMFGAAAIAAVIMLALGGWFVAGKSTQPVERAIAHMRRFMADAAHELRTPLSVVRTRAEVALQLPRDEGEYREALRQIENESTRVSKIVDDLLMLARADTGERPIECNRLFLDDVVLDAIESARSLAEPKHVRIDIHEFEEASVLGDAALLRQIVLILLDNAIKFTYEFGVVIVDVGIRDGLAVVSVADDGIGIPPDHLLRVFERFFRGDPARTRDMTGVSTGAGLGLSIAQWIAEEHGASIEIASELGRGTRVAVNFPVAGRDAM